MRPRLFLLVLFLTFGLAPTTEAQVRFLPYVGYNLNAGYDLEGVIADEPDRLDTSGGFFVGVGAEFSLTPGILPVAVKLRPSVESAFLPGESATFEGIEGTQEIEITQTFLQVNGDVIAELSPPGAPLVPYAGVGITYVTYSLDGSSSGNFVEETQSLDGSAVGFNLLGGARFGSGFVAPFVQARYSIADPSPDEARDAGNEIGNALSILAGVSIGL